MKKKLIFIPILVTIFLDMLGVGIIIPILAPLFVDPVHSILNPSMSEATRNMLFGFLMASYPLAQWFGAPILGALADRQGRKKWILGSLIGTMLGYLIFAFGVMQGTVLLLFVGRLLAGFMGGNISIMQSAIADISDEKNRSRNFGLIGMAFGLGFIFGPYIGGKLADPNLVSWFDFATPFWFAAILTFINIILAIVFFQETLKERTNRPFNLLTGPKNIVKAFSLPNFRVMFLVAFLFSFGFSFFTQFFQVYLIDVFQFNQSQIGNVFAYVGLFIAFTQGVLNRKVSQWLKPHQILRLAPLGLALALLFILVPGQSGGIFYVLPFVAIFNGLTYPNLTAQVSILADEKSQGEILGINQSLHSLGQALPPLLAGFLVTINSSLPIFLGACSVAISWFIFLFFFKPKAKQEFHEV
ncbi:MAG: MFS transporter [Patescibacteria group bacterium]